MGINGFKKKTISRLDSFTYPAAYYYSKQSFHIGFVFVVVRYDISYRLLGIKTSRVRA